MSEQPLVKDGWFPPATIGGTWCRVSPDGIYEMLPKTWNIAEIIPYEERSASLKALFGTMWIQ